MEQRRIWQIGVVLLVAVSGVLGYMSSDTSSPEPDNATNNTPPTQLSDTPPELVLFVDDTPVYGEEGSYCWTGRTQSQCVDKIGPAALVSDIPATSVSSNASYEIRAPGAPAPVSAHYAIHRPNNSIISTGDTAQFSLPDLPPGTYIVTGSANWERGDVSYAFKIRLTE